MRVRLWSFLALASLLLPATTASAESQCAFGVRFRPLDVSPVTIRFRETSLRLVFVTLEQVTGTQFRFPPELDYKVSFDIRNLPACRALEIIGASQSLTYRQEADTIVVVPPATAAPPMVPATVPEKKQ